MLPISSTSTLLPGVTQLAPLGSPSRRLVDGEDGASGSHAPIPGTPQNRTSLPATPVRSSAKSGSKRVVAVRHTVTFDPGPSLTCSPASHPRHGSEGQSVATSPTSFSNNRDRSSTADFGLGRQRLSSADDHMLQRLGSADANGTTNAGVRVKQHVTLEQIDCRPQTTPALRRGSSLLVVSQPQATSLPSPGRPATSLPLHWRQSYEQSNIEGNGVPFSVTKIQGVSASSSSGHMRRSQTERTLPEVEQVRERSLPEVDQFRVDVTLLPHMPIESQKQLPLTRPQGGVKKGGKILTSSSTMPTLGNASAPPVMLLKGKSTQASQGSSPSIPPLEKVE